MEDQYGGEMEGKKEKIKGKEDHFFTIRGFVAAMRERDITKCWPFTSAHLEASMREFSHSYGDHVCDGNRHGQKRKKLVHADPHLLPPFYPPVSTDKLNLNESFFTSGPISYNNNNKQNHNNGNDIDDDDSRSLQPHDLIQIQIDLLSKATIIDHPANHATAAHDQGSLSEKKNKIDILGRCNDNHHGGCHNHPATMTRKPFHYMNRRPTLQSRQSIREIRQSIIDQACRCCSEATNLITTAARGPNDNDDGLQHMATSHLSPQTSSMLMMTTDSCGSINGVVHRDQPHHDAVMQTLEGQMKPIFNVVLNHGSSSISTESKEKFCKEFCHGDHDVRNLLCDDGRTLSSHNLGAAHIKANDLVNRESASNMQCASISPASQNVPADGTFNVNVHINLSGSSDRSAENNNSNTYNDDDDDNKHALRLSESDEIDVDERGVNALQEGLLVIEEGCRTKITARDRQDDHNSASDTKRVVVSGTDAHHEEALILSNPDSNITLDLVGHDKSQQFSDAAKSVDPLPMIIHVNSTSTNRQVAHGDHAVAMTSNNNININHNNCATNTTTIVQKCPICLHFQASSNTALNAHIDHCLASTSTANQSRSVESTDINTMTDGGKTSKANKTIPKVSKPRKIKSRSIAELCAIVDVVPASASRRQLGSNDSSADTGHQHYHDADAHDNIDNHNSSDEYHEDDPAVLRKSSGLEDESVINGISRGNYRRKRTKIAGPGRSTRSSSLIGHEYSRKVKAKEAILTHDDVRTTGDSDGCDDDDDPVIIMSHQSRRPAKVQASCKLVTAQLQKHLKESFTDSSSSSTKTLQIKTLPASTILLQDQTVSKQISKSINPASGRRSVLLQRRSKNTISDLREKRSRIVSAPSSKVETGSAKLHEVLKFQNRTASKSKRNVDLLKSRRDTGVEIRKSSKKRLIRRIEDDPNGNCGAVSGSWHKNPVQGSYRQMLQAIRADVLPLDHIQVAKSSSAYTDHSSMQSEGNDGIDQSEEPNVCNHKDAEQSSHVEQAITEQHSSSPSANPTSEHSIVIMHNAQPAQVDVVNIPEADYTKVSEKLLVQSPLHHASEVSECSRSVNQAAVPAISSIDLRDKAAIRIPHEMSNVICTSALTAGCNASSSVDPVLALQSGGSQPTVNEPYLRGLQSPCHDPTSSGWIYNQHSNSDQFTSQALDPGAMQRVRSTTVQEPPGIPKSTTFRSAAHPDSNSFQYTTVSSQHVIGNNQKNSLPSNNQEEFRTLVVVNLINPLQANGVGNISTPITAQQGHPRADFVRIPSVRSHSQHHPANVRHETSHFPNQQSSARSALIPTDRIPIQTVSQLQTGAPIIEPLEEDEVFPRSLPPWMEAAIKDTAAPAFLLGNGHDNCSTCALEMRQHPVDADTNGRTSPVFEVNGKPVFRLMGKTMVLTPGGNGQNQMVDTCSGNWFDSRGSNVEYLNFPQQSGSCRELRARKINPQQQADSQMVAGLAGRAVLSTDSRVMRQSRRHPTELPCTFLSAAGQSTQLGPASSTPQEAQYAPKVIKQPPQLCNFQMHAGSNMYVSARQADQLSYVHPYDHSDQPAKDKSSAVDTTRIDDAYLCFQQQRLKDQFLYNHHSPSPNSYHYSSYPPLADQVSNTQQYIGHVHAATQPHLDIANISKPPFSTLQVEGKMVSNPQALNNNGNTATTSCQYPPCWKPNAGMKHCKPHQAAEVVIIDDDDDDDNNANISGPTTRSIPRLFGQDLNPANGTVASRHRNTIHGAHQSHLNNTSMEPGPFNQAGRSIHNSLMDHGQINACALKPSSTMIRAPSQQAVATLEDRHDRPRSGVVDNYGAVINPRKRANHGDMSSSSVPHLGGSRKCATMTSNQQVFLQPSSIDASSASFERFVVVQRRPANHTSSHAMKQKRKTGNNTSNHVHRDVSASGISSPFVANSQARDMIDAHVCQPNYALLNALKVSELGTSPPDLERSLVEKCSVNMNPAEVDFHDASQFLCTSPSININMSATQKGGSVRKSRFIMNNPTRSSSDLQTTTKQPEIMGPINPRLLGAAPVLIMHGNGAFLPQPM